MEKSAFPILLLTSIPGLPSIAAQNGFPSRQASGFSPSPPLSAANRLPSGQSSSRFMPEPGTGISSSIGIVNSSAFSGPTSALPHSKPFSSLTPEARYPSTDLLSEKEYELLDAAILADTLQLLFSLPNPIFIATEPQCSLLYLTGCLSHLENPPPLSRLAPEMIFAQEGDTPEARLFHAISFVSANYSPGMLVIRRDAPTVPRRTLETALSASFEDGAFCVGPCLDGGTYLFSLPSERSRNLRWLENALFAKDKPSLPLLLRHAAEVGLPVKMLEYHARVSTLQDLVHLAVCKELGAFLPPDDRFTYPLNSIATLEALRLDIRRSSSLDSIFTVVKR